MNGTITRSRKHCEKVMGLALFWAAAATAHAETVALDYRADASLSYVDKLKKPSVKNPLRLSAPRGAHQWGLAATSGPRTLGLERLALGLALRTATSTLDITLRPDALLERRDQEGPQREFDTRAGETYRPARAISLLDAYRLSIHNGDDLDLSLGVFEQMYADQASYAPVLRFGLLAVLPENYLGAELTWRSFAPIATTAQPEPQRGIEVSLLVFEGRDDRGERLGESSESYDTATVAADPYRGGALKTRYVASGNQVYGLAVGLGTNSAEGGKVAELFAAISGLVRYDLFGRNAKTTLDARFTRERWSIEQGPRQAELTQQSISLTTSHELLAGQWLAWGGHYGKSERHAPDNPSESLPVRGWQLDLGYVYRAAANVDLSVFSALEKRTTSVAGSDVGAFRSDVGQDDKIARFGLRVRYVIAGT